MIGKLVTGVCGFPPLNHRSIQGWGTRRFLEAILLNCVEIEILTEPVRGSCYTPSQSAQRMGHPGADQPVTLIFRSRQGAYIPSRPSSAKNEARAISALADASQCSEVAR